LPHSFNKQFTSWRSNVTKHQDIDWAEQLNILNNITELITPQLSIEEITAAVYENVNHLMDAYQFAVGIYNEKEGVILYRGMIEDGKRIPDFVVNAMDEKRLASWCIRHEEDIFMNDYEKEVTRYVIEKPRPVAGSDPRAAIYTPLKLNDKIAGLIVVRTIHKNVYKQHHLQILKTVGNFIVRALEIAKVQAEPVIKALSLHREWQWCDAGKFSLASKKIFDRMTGREKEVLFMLITGMPNKTIAEKLFVSPGTIKTHTLNIYQKLDVPNRTAAILKAIEWGWVA
jgi:DNA-binding CsgD family transcriptional regulator/transcriptional regulator with GAF, ATPase, and Fis domain